MASLVGSDKTIKGSTVQSKVVSKKKAWRDLDLNFIPHPIRGDVVPLKDDNAIKQAVRNLLVSNFFDRPFQPELGANLKGLLFEPADYITRIDIKDGIQNVLTQYEPRIQLLNINVEDLSDRNAYRILVVFRIKEYDTEESVEIVLRRLR